MYGMYHVCIQDLYVEAIEWQIWDYMLSICASNVFYIRVSNVLCTYVGFVC